jgi:hypothetical protein
MYQFLKENFFWRRMINLSEFDLTNLGGYIGPVGAQTELLQ